MGHALRTQNSIFAQSMYKCQVQKSQANSRATLTSNDSVPKVTIPLKYFSQPPVPVLPIQLGLPQTAPELVPFQSTPLDHGDCHSPGVLFGDSLYTFLSI